MQKLTSFPFNFIFVVLSEHSKALHKETLKMQSGKTRFNLTLKSKVSYVLTHFTFNVKGKEEWVR